MKECINCKNIVANDAEKCPNCGGTEFSNAKNKECPYCHFDVPLDAIICPNCRRIIPPDNYQSPKTKIAHTAPVYPNQQISNPTPQIIQAPAQPQQPQIQYIPMPMFMPNANGYGMPGNSPFQNSYSSLVDENKNFGRPEDYAEIKKTEDNIEPQTISPEEISAKQISEDESKVVGLAESKNKSTKNKHQQKSNKKNNVFNSDIGGLNDSENRGNNNESGVIPDIVESRMQNFEQGELDLASNYEKPKKKEKKLKKNIVDELDKTYGEISMSNYKENKPISTTKDGNTYIYNQYFTESTTPNNTSQNQINSLIKANSISNFQITNIFVILIMIAGVFCGLYFNQFIFGNYSFTGFQLLKIGFSTLPESLSIIKNALESLTAVLPASNFAALPVQYSIEEINFTLYNLLPYCEVLSVFFAIITTLFSLFCFKFGKIRKRIFILLEFWTVFSAIYKTIVIGFLFGTKYITLGLYIELGATIFAFILLSISYRNRFAN